MSTDKEKNISKEELSTDNDPKEPSSDQEGQDTIGFPDDVDFRKNLGCGG